MRLDRSQSPETEPARRPGSRHRRHHWLLRRFVRDTDGSTAVEFALIALPFVALLGAILESAIAFLASQVLDTAVTDASRLIRTGQAQEAKMDKAAFSKEVCKKLYVLFDCSKISVESVVYANFGAITNTPPKDGSGNYDATKVVTFQTGGASQIVVVRVFYEWPLFFNKLGFNLANTANGKRLLTGVAAFRNEPFPW